MEEKLKEYEKLKQELKKSLQEKTQLEDEYDKLLQEVYNKETEYLSNSTGSKGTFSGNIVKGFDGFAKPHGHDSNGAFHNSDRIFSLSSAIYIKQQESQNHNHGQD
ncbi:hypothetical protein Kpol_520p12 [Vanderwaltozyma polyspora DSM 70294]|uniref:Chromatin modification-related protein EAF6 n=1 Tax=Vanderwaltozyma polyspora (strain ATCC 22028 / DSM 70294 / BCRC 21397 / CBS 2163 / NBRC 10782 / NRRL Y-8283 / UCD 57-17) TaxID=436907 RepID=A7TM97_VANPO|nr:uncharacterized protein Kpol_520p12 [Vanderwaltozyma polyspora DSM 70294]EDO16591.1 hypothetical protein Kpol_520p12 [Vanderwaltozyma polyspora DSM 70294]